MASIALDGRGPQPDISRIEIPQRSSLLPLPRCAILSVEGADSACLDSGPTGLPDEVIQ
jgi:hypothetical protein